jgi:hypothetical protein
MLVHTAHTAHPEVREIVPSAHALGRFRRRRPVHAPGTDPVLEELLEVLASADVSRWPPAWAVSDRPATWWAVRDGLAFPLVPAEGPGRWLAVTCLRRGGR